MRATIDQREVLSAFGRIHFYVDCSVLFSEAERAVIRNRQLGDHSIEVGPEVPIFRSHWGYVSASTGLGLITWLTGLSLLPLAACVLAFGMNGGWLFLALCACIGSLVYRILIDRRMKKSGERRTITLTTMMKGTKFTVCTPDAYYANAAEKAIVVQLNELKERMVAIAPGLAEHQVYALE